jgi:Ca2+-transporting ATPase
MGAGSDYRKQAQFRSLNDFGKSLKTAKVLRDGQTIEMRYEDIITGDIVEVQTGMVVPADGVLFSGYNVEADESAMTGEPHAIRKDFENDPFLISGTNVVSGVGKMIVIATGVHSLNGRSLMALEIESEDTPLQVKLGRLADIIAKFAFYLAISLVVILLIIYFIMNPKLSSGLTISQDLLALLILAVTIVVVAVPEGLPLAVTISLAHATLEMLKDNNLVRHLAACETMGKLSFMIMSLTHNTR